MMPTGAALNCSNRRGGACGKSFHSVGGSTICNYTDLKQAEKFTSCVQQSDIKSLKKILKIKGFDANLLFRFESGVEKMSALHYATKEGLVKVVRELLEFGCDANVTTPFDISSPLHLACENHMQGNMKVIIEDLLNSGAEVNQVDHFKRTPLVICSEMGNLELVRLLLSHGADINACYNEEEMPDSVRHSMSSELSERDLDELCDPYRGNNSLLQACRERHLDVVEELLSRGCDVRAANTAGNTALHLACKAESRSIYTGNLSRAPVDANPTLVRILLMYTHDIDSRNKHMDTPLKRAIDGIYEIEIWNIAIEEKINETKKFLDVIDILIREGCDVRAKYYGLSALSLLLQTNVIAKYNCLMLNQALVNILYKLVAGGCCVDEDDIAQCETVLQENCRRSLASFFLEHLYKSPPTLKLLARWRIRKLCSKPLPVSLTKLGLPTYLCRYTALSVIN